MTIIGMFCWITFNGYRLEDSEIVLWFWLKANRATNKLKDVDKKNEGGNIRDWLAKREGEEVIARDKEENRLLSNGNKAPID